MPNPDGYTVTELPCYLHMAAIINLFLSEEMRWGLTRMNIENVED